jgi:hypothetical protein
MANFKNTAYSNTRRTSTGKDAAAHWHNKKQLEQQDQRIALWLKNNPQAAKAYYKQTKG